ncbi:Pleckstrin homology domain-containing protein [Phyllosticta citribraziliensis]|uniref:Pleckstrin homology domain-containing protein n=1 Tax=Phyllosticta citribraziliensis TaxID=989973 RepID=A0ABR1LNL7_9PEZI
MSDSKPLDTPATEPVAVAPVSDAAAPTTTEAAPVADVPATDAPAATTETPAAAADSAAPAADETTALPVEEKKGEDEVKITAEPIYSGSLGYKAPGLLKSLTYSKKFFWFGEEPVTKDSLSAYLRGEKAEVGHSTAAWASKTGKGILFFAKNAEQKANPAGALKLADASDVTKEGNVAFFFKFHGHKHQFEASSQAERDGWIVSIEKGIEEAKVASEEVTSSEEYKATIEALAKPATATTGKADESAPKKSTEVKPTEGAERPSSTSSSDENAEGKKTAKKNKSRSVSRKRASVFGLLGKKDDKKEVKKEEESKEVAKEEAKEEQKAEAEAAPTTEGAAVEPVAETAADEAKPAEEVKPVEGEAAAVAAEPEVKPTPTPKANKRTSIFGNFFEKVRSPAAEKKESEVAPTVPPKDNEVVAAPAEETAVATDAAEPTVAATEPATTEAAEPKPVTTPTPAKEKAGFFSKFGKKKEVESPAAETPAVVEAKPEEATTPAVDGEAAAAPAPKATPEPINKEKRRTSFFGNFGAKGGEADGEKKKGLGGLFRNPSKAVKSNKDKEAAPTKVEEEPETKAEEAKAEDKVEEPKAEENTTEESKPTIGDVVPEAVQANENQATPTVQATA